MALSFGEQIKNWSRMTETRTKLVFQESIQELGKELNKPQKKGGDVPVVTSFLWNSFGAAINGPVYGESKKPDNYTKKDWNPTEFILVVNKAKIGDRVTVGYTANYAIYMEAKYGFVRKAAQNWPYIVNRVVKRMDARIAFRGLKNE